MASQQSLVLIKPDAVQRGHIADVMQRFERKGLKLVGAKLVSVSEAQAKEHYAEHAEKPFFPKLLAFITSAPVMALAYEGDEAISVIRTLVGPTDGRNAPPGTIRGDFGLSKSANLVHASDSPDSAQRELALWFPEGLIAWDALREAAVYAG